MKSKAFLVAVASIVVIGGAVAGFSAFGPKPQQAAAQQRQGGGAPAAIVRTAPVLPGAIRAVFGYSGAIQASQQVNVVPRTASLIQDIAVDVGSSVKKGDVVVVMDQGALPAQLQQAQANLQSAQARLALVQSGAKPEDVAAARAQLEQARTRLSGLQTTYTQAQQTRDQDVATATAALDSAQARLELLQAGGRAPDVAQAQVDQARANLDAAQAKLEALKKGSTNDVRVAAASQVEQDRIAVATADQALKGADASIASANAARTLAIANIGQSQVPNEVDLQAARLVVLQAQRDLDAANATLVALNQSRGGACQGTVAVPADSSSCEAAKEAQRSTIAAAEQNLATAKLRLNLLNAGGTPAQQAQLRSALAAADAQIKAGETAKVTATNNLATAQEKLKVDQARLDQINLGPSAEDIRQQQDAVIAAQQALKLAQTPATAPTEQDLRIQENAVEQARQALEKAMKAPTDNDVQVQVQTVVQMDAQLKSRINAYTDADLQAAYAGIAQAEAAVAVAQANLDQTVLVAPIDGVVTARLQTVGALGSTQNPILTIMSNGIEVRLTVEEARIGLVKTGQVVQMTAPAYPNVQFPGKVVAIAPTGDARAHTFDVKIVPDTVDERLRIGMFTQASLIASEKTNALLVPREAVTQQDTGAFVWVAADGRAQKRTVEVGLTDETNAEIVSGLQPNEQVVIIGQNSLRDGAAVTVPGAATGARPGGAPAGQQGGQGAPQGKPDGAGAAQPGGAAGAQPGGAAGGAPRQGGQRPAGGDGATTPAGEGGAPAGAPAGQRPAGQQGGQGAPAGAAPAQTP